VSGWGRSAWLLRLRFRQRRHLNMGYIGPRWRYGGLPRVNVWEGPLTKGLTSTGPVFLKLPFSCSQVHFPRCTANLESFGSLFTVTDQRRRDTSPKHPTSVCGRVLRMLPARLLLRGDLTSELAPVPDRGLSPYSGLAWLQRAGLQDGGDHTGITPQRFREPREPSERPAVRTGLLRASTGAPFGHPPAIRYGQCQDERWPPASTLIAGDGPVIARLVLPSCPARPSARLTTPKRHPGPALSSAREPQPRAAPHGTNEIGVRFWI
jgi:hypothetical protein